jgi:hypothetical protein
MLTGYFCNLVNCEKKKKLSLQVEVSLAKKLCAIDFLYIKEHTLDMYWILTLIGGNLPNYLRQPITANY